MRIEQIAMRVFIHESEMNEDADDRKDGRDERRTQTRIIISVNADCKDKSLELDRLGLEVPGLSNILRSIPRILWELPLAIDNDYGKLIVV